MAGDNKIDVEVSNKLVNMSFVCALLVVTIHCDYNLFGFNQIAVPFFFAASGYLLGRHVDELGWWKRETIKRVHSLLYPFLIWSLLYQVAFMPLSIYADFSYADFSAGRAFGSSIPLLNGGLLSVLGLVPDSFPATVHLWYLRALFIFVLLSALIVNLLKKYPRFLLGSLFLFSVAMSYAPNPDVGGWSGVLQHFINVQGLFYLAAGLCLRVRPFPKIPKWIGPLGLGVGIALLLANINIVLAIPFLLYGLWGVIPARKIEVLRGLSLPIYIMHCLFIQGLQIIVRSNGWIESHRDVISFPLAVLGSATIALTISRFFPRLNMFLFGGR